MFITWTCIKMALGNSENSTKTSLNESEDGTDIWSYKKAGRGKKQF
jgi:hypothetical protein